MVKAALAAASDTRRPATTNRSTSQGHCSDDRDASDDQPNHARKSPPEEAVPGGHAGEQHTAQQKKATGELGYRDRDRER